MENASFHTHDVKKRCENKLGIQFKKRRGKEFNGWYYIDDKKAARVTIPKGKKPIPPKTYKTMAKQLNLDIPQFDDLLKCPLKRDKYDKILRDKIEF